MKPSEKELEIEEQYRRDCVAKFGSYPPSPWDYCNICGKTYGEHYGVECPEEETNG